MVHEAGPDAGEVSDQSLWRGRGIETFVLDGPLFRERIEVLRASTVYAHYRGQYIIEAVRLVER